MQAAEITPTFFANPVALRAWLSSHHDTESELWVGFYKKASGRGGITYNEAVDEALCFGWIDGLKNRHDELSYKLRFTPRKAKSIWSKTNVSRVERLIEAGRMAPPGLNQIEAAKSDGRWEAAYAGARTITVPEDLQKLLDANPAAQEFFSTISSSNRYAFLFRLHHAKTPAARAKRLQHTIEMLSEGRVYHPGG